MPFHGHRHHDSSKKAGDGAAAAGMLQAAQALGSIGAPAGNLRAASSGTTSAGTDALVYPNNDISNPTETDTDAGHSNSRVPSMNHGGLASGPGGTLSSVPASTVPSSGRAPPPFETPRRAQGYSRSGDEHQLPSSSMNNTPAQYGNAPYPTRSDYSNPPSIALQQSTPQSSHYGAPNTSSGLPGTLQPGSSTRPGPVSYNTAPSGVPTLPQLATQQPQSQLQVQTPTTPGRSSTMSHAHSHTRSSPSGAFEHPKRPSDTHKYASPTGLSYSSQTPNLASYSPLGLADIRSRADLDDISSPTGYSPNGDALVPGNSNYVAPWSIYALDWCKWPLQPNGQTSGKVAIGSYLEDGHNFIQILEANKGDPMDNPGGEPGLDFVKTAEATHSYPVTRILWEPPSSQKQTTDLLATSGDHLRLWSLPQDNSHHHYSNSITRSSTSRDAPAQRLSPLALLSNSKSPEHTAPITSLDWNPMSPSLIITSSIDTTCTVWDIPTLTAKTQLIAHDKEVFDVRFCANSVDVFVSCGADGSVRMFDLRSLEHSTIIYEPSDKSEKVTSPSNGSPNRTSLSTPPPLLRIAASPHEAHLLATFSQDANIIRILDVRHPGQALLELRGHEAAINCIEWSPSHRGQLASGADDSLVLIWDLMNAGSAAQIPSGTIGGAHGASGAAAAAAASGAAGQTNERGPTAAWQCDFEVANVSWSPGGGGASGDWLGVVGGRGLWGVSF